MGTPLARAEMLSIMMQGQIWEYSLSKIHIIESLKMEASEKT